MPDLNWSKNAVAAIGPSGQSNYTDAREAEESNTSTVNTTATNPVACGTIRSSGRGSASFGFRRSYYGFDFTGYTTGTISNLALHYTPTTSSSNTLSVRLAQFVGFGEELGSNYTDNNWWDEIADPLVPYSNAFNSADNTTPADVTLLSQAITDAKADGFLKLVLMSAADYNNLNLAVDVTAFTNWNQSSNKTFLRFNYAAPGYNQVINGVPSDPDSKINDVSYTNVSQVMGVS